jgi:hypothetical protein
MGDGKKEKVMRVIILIAIASYCSFISAEYLYPVGASALQERMYVVYQKSTTHIELWEWDIHTTRANQMLLSRYSPAGFQLLPDESGFSFIDQGTLKVKQFIKRSPRTIEFDAPVCHVELVHWIDERNGYTSGRYLDRHLIFQFDWNGMVQPLVYHTDADALYPQKVDSSLFYIERKEGKATLMRSSYAPHHAEEWHDRIAQCEGATRTPLLVFDEPIAFLKMVSDTQGFVIGYPAEVHSREKLITFHYYQLSGSDDAWEKEYLFSFAVPTELLHAKSSERLYESILPLMPRIYEQEIMFVDAAESTGYLSIYRYDRQTHDRQRVTFKDDQHFFGVCGLGSQRWYGGALNELICLIEGFRIVLGLLPDF